MIRTKKLPNPHSVGSEVFCLQIVIHKAISHDKAFSEPHALRMIFCIYIQENTECNGGFYRFMQKLHISGRHYSLERDSFSSGPFRKNIVSASGKHEHRLSLPFGKPLKSLIFSLKDSCRKVNNNALNKRLSTEYTV